MARQKRGTDEKERTKLWYGQVNEGLFKAGVVKRLEAAGRTLGKAISGDEGAGPALYKNGLIDLSTKNALGSVEAWRWYQSGERTPGLDLRSAVDKLLIKLGQAPVGFILCGPGEVELEPVWVWNPKYSAFPESAKLVLSKIEKNFWKRFPSGGDTLVNLAVEAGVVDSSLVFPPEEIYGHDEEYGVPTLGKELEWTWPKRLLVPSLVASVLPRAPGAAFAHLFETCEEIDDERTDIAQEYTDKELINTFMAWANKNQSEDGEIWFYALRCLPGSPYYRPWAAGDEMDFVTGKKFDHLVRDIKDFFKGMSQKGHISGDGK